MNYLVFSEIIFFAAYAVEIYKLDALSTNIYLLIALVYACLKLLLYVLYDKKASKNLSILVFLLVGISAWFFYPMVLFFPLSLNQINLFTLKKGWPVSMLSLFWVFFIPSDFIVEYLIVFGFSIIIVYMQNDYDKKISSQDKKIEFFQKKQIKMKDELETYSQLAESVSYQSQLEERNKLSQTLHDELGHTLSGNILRLEAIKVTVEKEPQQAKGMLQEVINNLREGMNSIRLILKSVKPEVSTINIAKLQTVIDKAKKQSDVNITLKYNSDINHINQNSWQAVIPSIKEALTNMMKYSGAQNCEIEFTKLNKLYRVRVKDDGRGCKTIKKGLGIAGIEERMAMINGNAIIDAQDGFSVTMIFPV